VILPTSSTGKSTSLKLSILSLSLKLHAAGTTNNTPTMLLIDFAYIVVEVGKWQSFATNVITAGALLVV